MIKCDWAGPPAELAAYLAWRNRAGPAYPLGYPNARFNETIDRLNMASWFHHLPQGKLEFAAALEELREKGYHAP